MTDDHNDHQALDLDALIDAARVTAAQQRSLDSAVAHVVRLLAEGEGFAAVDTLLGQGIPRDVLAALVQPPTDRRAKARARLTVVAGDAYVHLTATGWQAAGRASGKERAPDAMSAAHAAAPGRIADWVRARAEPLAAQGVRASVASGATVRRFSEEVRARAWATLRNSSDGDGAIGLLTGGWLPDALLLTHFPMSEAGRTLYASCWGRPATPDLLAESIAALEVEDQRKASDPLRAKVAAAEAASTALGVVQAVLWIVRSREVADRLADLGVGQADGRAQHQLLVPARALGLDGDDLPVARPWWLLGVPPAAA